MKSCQKQKSQTHLSCTSKSFRTYLIRKTMAADFEKASDKKSTGSADSVEVPAHFMVHKPGCQLESCCGICNLFPGVLLIAFAQVLVGSILLTLILTHEAQYDELHQTSESRYMSYVTGALLSAITGAGLLLIVVALTENCRAMLIYLMVAAFILVGIFILAVIKITRACARFHDAPKIKDDQHRLANLACVSGLFTFLAANVPIGNIELKLGYNVKFPAEIIETEDPSDMTKGGNSFI